VRRLLSTQGDKGHDQHSGPASCDEAPEHEDLSNSALPSAGRGTVHKVAPTQHPRLHQALGLQGAGTLLFNSGFDRGEGQKLCLSTMGVYKEKYMCSASKRVCALMGLDVRQGTGCQLMPDK
jgi:hypothetical protein